MTRAEKITRRWVEIVAVLVAIVVILLAIVFIYARENTVASCINANLGVRNGPNVADKDALDALDALNAAQDRLNRAEQRDVWAFASGNPSQRQAAATDLTQALTTQHRAYEAYKAQRAKDDAARDKHPPGRC